LVTIFPASSIRSPPCLQPTNSGRLCVSPAARLSTPVLDGLESKSVQGDRDLRTDSYLPHAISHARYDPTYLLLRSPCQRTAFISSN
jgi:hypothetical protein